jgi:L-arabinokinase
VRARAAVADIPAIPIEAAAAEGVPALAVGNFSWNWIYERYADADGDPRWRDAAEAYAAGYARADLLLRLPFHEEMSAFPRREDVPVVAGPGRARRAEIAAALDGPAGATWVLLSFGTLAWPEAALRRLEALEDFVFLSVRPLEWRRRNFRAVDRNRFPFSDVLASADLVLTKPGFGIVSECVVNAKPVVCVERHDFAEAEVLAAALRRHARCVFVPQAALYAGDLADAFRLALVAPAPPEAVAAGGAQVAARRIAQLAGLE